MSKGVEYGTKSSPIVDISTSLNEDTNSLVAVIISSLLSAVISTSDVKSVSSLKVTKSITEEGSKSIELNDSEIGTIVSLISSDMSTSIEVAGIITVGMKVVKVSKSSESSSMGKNYFVKFLCVRTYQLQGLME